MQGPQNLQGNGGGNVNQPELGDRQDANAACLHNSMMPFEVV